MDDACGGWRMALNETGFKAGWLSLPLLPRLCMRMDKNLELILWICNGLQQIPGLCQELSFEPLCFTTTVLHWEQQFQHIRQRVTWIINNSVYCAHYMLCSVILNGQCCSYHSLLLGNSWREPLCASSAFRGAILTHNSWKGSLKAAVSLWGKTNTSVHTIQCDPISPNHLELFLLERRLITYTNWDAL